MSTCSDRPYLFDEFSKFQTANKNSEVLQQLEEVLGHLITIEHNQLKYQLEIDARLDEFEQNHDQSPTPQPILYNPQ